MSGDKASNFWSTGTVARLYRRFAGRHFAPMHHRVAEVILAAAPDDVLDIACGPGDMLARLSEQAPEVRLTGTDAAPGMVAHAREKLGGRARILEASGADVPFPPDSFDAAAITMAFHHFPGKTEALGKIGTLLRPGGQLVIADVTAKSNFQKKLWNLVERASGVRGFIDHYTEGDVRAAAESAGFAFAAEPVPGMAKRYRIFRLTKKSG